MIFLQRLASESPDSNTIQFLVVGFFLIVIGIVAYYYIKLKFGDRYNIALRFVKIKPEYKAALRKFCLYYNMLDDLGKVQFERRVQHFIFAKEFIPRQIPEVSAEMKALIAASAIQLTFGLPYIYLTHFQRILVYPGDYYSTITRRYHKGEVNPSIKAIVISWRHFMEGLINPTDSVNLGLHEMAHALWLENKIMNKKFGFLDKRILEKYKMLAEVEMLKIQSGAETFFRSYAGTDNYEFFAVSIENFFEKPYEFRMALPELYQVMCGLLNQDPLSLYSEEFLAKYKIAKTRATKK